MLFGPVALEDIVEGPLLAEGLLAVQGEELPGGGPSCAHRIQELAPEAKVVVAYNNLPAAALKAMGLDYVYLGYWVPNSRKMDYKGRFLPQERLAPAGWARVESEPG